MILGDIVEFKGMEFIVVELTRSLDENGEQQVKCTIVPLQQYEARGKPYIQD